MSEETPTPEPESANPQTPPPASEPPAAAAPVDPSTYTKEQKDKKLISGILAILLGALGVHKFYLGYTTEGIIMLAVSVVGSFLCFPPAAVGIVALIEGIIYLTKTDEEFVATYVVGRKGWF